MDGPSLVELWRRKAGSLPGFDRYSDALKASSEEQGSPEREQEIPSAKATGEFCGMRPNQLLRTPQVERKNLLKELFDTDKLEAGCPCRKPHPAGG